MEQKSQKTEKMAATGPNHTELVKAIVYQFNKSGKCFVWGNNTGALKAGSGRLVRFGLVGSPDIIGFDRQGRFIAVECKTGTGRLTSYQKDWWDKAAEAGVNGIVARDIHHALDFLNSL